MKQEFTILMLAVLCMAGVMQPALGAESGADKIKNSMLARKPQIDALKGSGAIGEDNKGFLAGVSGALSAADQATVSAENADRGQVYKAIAAKSGATAEDVGRRRAIQIAEQAKPGETIMNAAGKWVKK